MPDEGPGIPLALRVRHLARIRDVAPEDWDALHDAAYPFIRHAFLAALEDHACVGAGTGWEPCHAVLEDADGRIHAAMPLYRKLHSYGEFVFDFAWAQAAAQIGQRYYPKLVCAIPFTPVTGPRLLARDHDARRILADRSGALLRDSGCSSLHALFLDDADATDASARGLLPRLDIQFHWFNRGDGTFADFLARLRHDKRKKIQRERRRVLESGVAFEWRRGDELPEGDWARVFELYAGTYALRGQAPYLTLPFFLDYGARAGTPVRVVLARSGPEIVAAAIFLVGGGVLYGRHWGCARDLHSLHFETCCYQGIEMCLRDGIGRFDAGAQGEHKLARGFDPVITRSAHLLADDRLHRAVGAYLERERAWVDRQRRLLAAHAPYRNAAEVVAQDG